MYSLLLRTVLHRASMSYLLMALICVAACAPTITPGARFTSSAAADELPQAGSHPDTITVNFCRAPEQKPAQVIADAMWQSNGRYNLVSLAEDRWQAMPNGARGKNLSHFARRLLCGVLRA